jgi:cytochrome c551/c552
MAQQHVWPTFALLVFACSSTPSPPATGSGNYDSGSSADGAPNVVATADTWTNYAEAFFAQYCTSCHNAQDTTGRDYTVAATVAKDRASMRCGVAATQDPSWNCSASPPAKQFPIGSGPKPTDAERNRIVLWITAGEP